MTTTSLRSPFVAGLVLVIGISGTAATADAQALFYVRAGGGGAQTGQSWADALPALPAALVRGATYYVADGTYGDVTFNTPVSGAVPIVIRKANLADHGTEVGWSPAYGDGQAVFTGSLHFVTGYFVIDGATRNEDDWQDSESYGFRIQVAPGEWAVRVHGNDGDRADFVTLRYVDIGAARGSSICNGPEVGIYVVYNGQTNWTISRAHIHNVRVPIQVVTTSNFTVEHSHIGPSWSKEAISSVASSGWVIRHNRFVDNLVFPTGCEADGSGGTADIWTRNRSGGHDDNWSIYGNVFADTGAYPKIVRNNAIIQGDCYDGNGVSNWKVYNNAFYNIGGNNASVRVCGDANNVVVNNLWYKLRASNNYPTEAARVSVAATTYGQSWCFEDTKLTIASGCSSLGPGGVTSGVENPFVDASRLNFQLKGSFLGPQPADQGITLGAGFDEMDGLGHKRGGDGRWDIGPFERGPAAPSGVRVIR